TCSLFYYLRKNIFMIQILSLLFYFVVPYLVILLCRKYAVLNKIGEILALYIIGILISNVFVFPLGLGESLKGIQDTLTSVMILLAFPMILFGCNFKKWKLKNAIVALCIGLVSVIVIDVLGFYIFNDEQTGFEKIAGLLIGVYTGGTPNLASLKIALDVDAETYIFVHTFDMIISFVYLVFLMSFGIKVFRLFLRQQDNKTTRQQDSKTTRQQDNKTTSQSLAYLGVFTKKHFPKTLGAFGLAILIVGAGMGVSFLISGKIDNMLVLILTMTTLSIAASFLPFVRKMEKSYDAGMYLVLIFSFVVATMVDITAIDYKSGINIIMYIAFVIFCSLILSMILAKIFKVDSDTMVITSVALINSPLFVPMIAENMKNKNVIITGITVGIIGYAVGNYLGILVYQLL
ncbi:MAG: DUF819 family protein, partial [Bacteroidales bacterium]|nr:DUF819 family protein [Bacteroidales bacterium]